MTLQSIPPQSQPVDESGSGSTMDRTWYRYLQSIFTNLNDQGDTVRNQSGQITTITNNLNIQTTNLNTLTSEFNTLNAEAAIWVSAPVHNTSIGIPNQIARDSSYLYICIATNSWARVAIGGSW